MNHRIDSTCRYCREALLAKLGLCSACMIKATVFTLICVLGVLLTEPASRTLWITWWFGVAGFGGLLVLHLLFSLFYRLGWRTPPKS